MSWRNWRKAWNVVWALAVMAMVQYQQNALAAGFAALIVFLYLFNIQNTIQVKVNNINIVVDEEAA